MVVVFGKAVRQSKTSLKFNVGEVNFFSYCTKSATGGLIELYASFKSDDYFLLSTFFKQEQVEMFITSHIDDIIETLDKAVDMEKVTRDEFIKQKKS